MEAKKQINKYGLLNALISIVNANDEDESKVIMAKYFLRNFDRLHEINIFDAAEECFVTRASIRRFSKSIGFDNFRDLKSDVEEYKYYHVFTDESDYPNYLMNQTTKMMDDCNLCLKKQLDNILKYIQECNQIVFLVSDIYSAECMEFQKGMILAGKMVRVVSHKFTDNKLLDSLNENDLLIIISISGGFAARINEFVESFKCKKTFLTAVNKKEFNDKYDLVLNISSEELPQTKTVYHMFAIEYCLDIIYNEYRRRNK